MIAVSSTTYFTRRRAEREALAAAEDELRAILASLPASGLSRVAAELALDALKRLEPSIPSPAQERIHALPFERAEVEAALEAVGLARARFTERRRIS